MSPKHPTQEKLNRFPRDTQLRNHGWRIHSRPRVGPDTWINVAGIIMTEDEALANVDEWIRRQRGREAVASG